MHCRAVGGRYMVETVVDLKIRRRIDEKLSVRDEGVREAEGLANDVAF